MRKKISNFLFPIKAKEIGDGKVEYYITIRFGIISIWLWDLYCKVFGND